MSKKNTWHHCNHGDGIHTYGIWNNMRKEFQFGICEDSPKKAEKALFRKIGKDAYKWRFEVRKSGKKELKNEIKN